MSSLYPLQRKLTERAPKVSQELAANLLGVVLSWGITYAGYRAFLALLELGSGSAAIFQSGVGEACAKALAARHERAPRLSGHEAQLSGSVVDRRRSTLDDVGGLEAIVEELRDLVVWPLRHPGAFAGASRLARAPRGVLLYGEPGTGKTLVARGLARESGAALMDVRVSTLADKYYGESNKLVAATFSLARKLAPCVLFLDEVDGLLRSRSSGETEVTVSVKAEFMSHLDGLLVAPDEAERPVYRISLPDAKARRQILGILLKGDGLDGDVDLEDVADRTPRFSGSDLEELCRAAVTRPVREVAAALRAGSDEAPRRTAMRDFDHALRHVFPTADAARRFQASQQVGFAFDPPPDLRPGAGAGAEDVRLGRGRVELRRHRDGLGSPRAPEVD
ncbi:ATP binding protein [Aureococcus anophagefferens]|nr:ATP binding protein [Aureococcus anophagefferens]